jgi:arsenate reductase
MIVSADAPLGVLFLCTGNSARSIMAEALLNALGEGRFHAYSAGSRPTGRVNPLAIAMLQDNGVPTAGLRSKSWDEFASPGAPRMEVVFTVCDQAGSELCPVWPGAPVRSHWGLPDPAAVVGSEQQRRQAFAAVFAELQRRLGLFVQLPVAQLGRMQLEDELRAIARAGASIDSRSC